jgi:hypothetical protein
MAMFPEEAALEKGIAKLNPISLYCDSVASRKMGLARRVVMDSDWFHDPQWLPDT